MSQSKVDRRPRFLSLWWGEVRDDYSERGLLAVVPIWLGGILWVSFWLAWQIPYDFFKAAHWDISTAVYGGALTFNGLLLALSWQAFSRVQASISAPGFSSFLKRRNLIAGYLFWIDYVQFSQVVAVCVSAVGLVSVLLVFPEWADRLVLCGVMGFSVYAVKSALDAMQLMHDLVWLHAEYDQMVQDAPSNVAQFPGRASV